MEARSAATPASASGPGRPSKYDASRPCGHGAWGGSQVGSIAAGMRVQQGGRHSTRARPPVRPMTASACRQRPALGAAGGGPPAGPAWPAAAARGGRPGCAARTRAAPAAGACAREGTGGVGLQRPDSRAARCTAAAHPGARRPRPQPGRRAVQHAAAPALPWHLAAQRVAVAVLDVVDDLRGQGDGVGRGGGRCRGGGTRTADRRVLDVADGLRRGRARGRGSGCSRGWGACAGARSASGTACGAGRSLRGPHAVAPPAALDGP